MVGAVVQITVVGSVMVSDTGFSVNLKYEVQRKSTKEINLDCVTID